MRTFATAAIGLALTAGLQAPAAALEVVVSIKPVHSLVAGVMAGAGEPTLLIKGGGSPHSYSLKPSEARALNQANLIFWIGEGMETFLEKPLEALAGSAEVVALAEAPGIALLDSREGGSWEGHGHDEHADHEGHDDHDDHAKHDDHDDHDDHAKHDEHDDHDDHAKHDEHDDHDDHAKHDEHDDHDDHAKHDEHDDHDDHAKHEGHGHEAHNLHLWLSPSNAKAVVTLAAAHLSKADPGNASLYQGNAETLIKRIESQDQDTAALLKPVAGVPFVVFHDAYHYFEQHYGLRAVGSVTISPERKPGAKRLIEIREKIAELKATCVFSEPQFPPGLVETVVEDTAAKTGTLDPLGAALEPGPEAYFELMSGLAKSLRRCLAPAS